MYPSNRHFSNFCSSVLLLSPRVPHNSLHFFILRRHLCSQRRRPCWPTLCVVIPNHRRPSRRPAPGRPHARHNHPHPRPSSTRPAQSTPSVIIPVPSCHRPAPNGSRPVSSSPSSAAAGPPHAHSGVHGPHGPGTRRQGSWMPPAPAPGSRQHCLPVRRRCSYYLSEL
jgi:hypothetical protein